MSALRPGLLLVLGAGVLAAHLWLAERVLPPPIGADGPLGTRIEVSFVRELAPVAVLPPPPPPAPRLARMAAAPAPAASAAAAEAALEPLLPASAPAVDTAELLPALPPLPERPPDAVTAAAAPASAASAAAVEWPPSTRLSYTLTGDVRGPVEGQARVEWLRQGTRYQVFLEASIGPFFAPLMTRRESSEGEITAAGLQPRRYDMEMDVVFRGKRRSTIHMDPDAVRLPNGQTLPRPADLQDAVSQFVQLTWLFTTQPARLAAGETVTLSLALPRRVEPWVYDIVANEPVYTIAGLVDAWHVRPRQAARAGDYTAEIWVAPSLQYLPVRILVRQDAETYIDLQIKGLPEQAER